MYLASQDGNLDCLKYLHSVDGKCDARARDGMLPIHGAAQNGHLDCVGYLVRKGRLFILSCNLKVVLKHVYRLDTASSSLGQALAGIIALSSCVLTQGCH